MITCPKCGAKENVPGKNLGPTVLRLERRQYRAMCLHCWYKAQPGKTAKIAKENWNSQLIENPFLKKRKELGLTAKELSKITNISMNQIYRYERDQVKPSKLVLERLKSGLGIA